MQAGDAVTVSVDNIIAVQNLEKMAVQKQIAFSYQQIDTYHYEATFQLGETAGAPQQPVVSNEQVAQGVQAQTAQKTVVVLASDVMGEGDPKLGTLLMKGFIYALTEQDTLPDTILLYNKGAYLSTQSSESIADLKLLEAQGVEVLTCGTCLNHYGLTEQLAVGSATNMYVIVEKQMEAHKVIKP